MQAEIISIDVEILDKLNKAYVDSVQKSDVRWFDEHLSEDFLNSSPDGSIVDRAGFLAQIARSAELPHAAYPTYFVHLVLVFFLLAYSPYSKFAHVFYRPAAMLIARYREARSRAAGDIRAAGGVRAAA